MRVSHRSGHFTGADSLRIAPSHFNQALGLRFARQPWPCWQDALQVLQLGGLRVHEEPRAMQVALRSGPAKAAVLKLGGWPKAWHMAIGNGKPLKR